MRWTHGDYDRFRDRLFKGGADLVLGEIDSGVLATYCARLFEGCDEIRAGFSEAGIAAGLDAIGCELGARTDVALPHRRRIVCACIALYRDLLSHATSEALENTCLRLWSSSRLGNWIDDELLTGDFIGVFSVVLALPSRSVRQSAERGIRLLATNQEPRIRPEVQALIERTAGLRRARPDSTGPSAVASDSPTAGPDSGSQRVA